MSGTRITVITIAAGLGLSLASQAWAQSNPIFDANGFQSNRDYVTPATFGPGLNATEHIDPVTGSLLLTFVDLTLPGPAGRDLVFQRTYNSKGPFGGAPGTWTFGIAGIPVAVSDGWPQNPEFHPLLQTTDGGGSKAATNLYPLAQGQAVRMTDRLWKYYRNSRILWMPDGTVVHFADGRLSSVVDSFGNTVLTVTYAGQIVTVTQILGSEQRVVTIEFPPGCGMGGNACVPISMSFAERTWSYTGNGFTLSAVEPPEGMGPGWHYEYTASDPIRTIKVITPHGGSVVYTIENLGFPWVNGETYFTNVIRSRQALDVRGGQSGGTWTFDYDWTAPEYAKSGTVLAPDGTRTKYNYGPVGGANNAEEYFGRAYSVTQRKTWKGASEPACDQALECETREYVGVAIPSWTPSTVPELTKRTIKRDGQTYVTEYHYRPENFGNFHTPHEIVETGQLSRTTSRTFLHSSNAPYDGPYIVAKQTGESVSVSGQTFSKAWDPNPANGFVRSETIFGITTAFQPDAYGNVVTVTKQNGKGTTFGYQWGQVGQIQTPGVTTTRTFNALSGTLASEISAGLTTTYRYDDLFRVTAIEPPGGTNPLYTDYSVAATVVSGRGASQTTVTLDGFGRPVHTVDAVGVHMSTTYDAMGRTTFASLPYRDGDPVVGTQYAYDGLGRVTCEADGTARCLPSPSGAYRRRVYSGNTVEVYDENNHKTVFTFAAFGSPDDARLVSVRDADNKLWTYGYNAVGSLTSVTSPDGVGNRSWTYDSRNLLTTETHPESGTTVYTYDAAGVLQTKRDAINLTLTYGYDGDDRLVSVTGPGVFTEITYEPGSNNRKIVRSNDVYSEYAYEKETGRLSNRQDTIEGAAFDTHFEYDNNDNLWKLYYPSGRRIEYEYNAENQILSVRNIKTGHVYSSEFNYHPSGGVRSYRAGNGLSTSVGYDSNRYWVTSIQAGPMQYTYGHDNVGNVTSIQDAHMGNQTFTYDVLDRLSTAGGPYSMTFAYDAHGNRQTTATGAYTYHPGKPFHLKTASGISGDMNYDANGNLISGPGVTLEYTPENMMKRSTAGGVTTLFSYDADQWRAYKVNQTTGVKSFYVRGPGNQLLSEWTNLNSSTAEVRDYIYAGSRLIAVQTISDAPAR